MSSNFTPPFMELAPTKMTDVGVGADQCLPHWLVRSLFYDDAELLAAFLVEHDTSGRHNAPEIPRVVASFEWGGAAYTLASWSQGIDYDGGAGSYKWVRSAAGSVYCWLDTDIAAAAFPATAGAPTYEPVGFPIGCAVAAADATSQRVLAFDRVTTYDSGGWSNADLRVRIYQTDSGSYATAVDCDFGFVINAPTSSEDA